MMNISRINPAAAYQGVPESIANKQVQKITSSPEASVFRAWTRSAGKILASTSMASALPSQQSSEAFWAQWPGKKWLTTQSPLKS